MKILHVIADLESRHGGPPRAVLGMCRALVRDGHSVELLTMTGGDESAEEPFVRSGSEPSGLTIRAFPRLRLFGWPVSLRLAATLSRHVRDFDVVHIHSLYLFHTFVASFCARRARVPYIVRPHGTLDPFLRRRGWLKKGLYNWMIERRTLNRAAAVHYTTELEMALAHKPLGLTSPALIVPLGIDPADFADAPGPEVFRGRHPEIGNRRVLLFLGRLHFKKGLDLLVDSFARVADQLPDVQLVIVGPDEGRYRPDIQQRAAAANIQGRVTFVDMLLGERKAEAYAAASAFVLPSYTENFGLSVIEAMGFGIPVIVSDRVGLSERIAAAAAGDVVTCHPDKVADALRRVLSDPDRSAAMGQRGKDLVASEFTWDRVAKQLGTAYKQVALGTVPGSANSMLRLPTSVRSRTRLRVLQVVPGVAPGYGGPSVALFELVKTLADRGVDTTLMTTNQAPGGKVQTALEIPIDHEGARVFYYDVWPNTRYASSSVLASALFATAEEYDLIHIHWLYNFSSLVAAAAARHRGVPYLLQPNGSLDPHLFKKNYLLKNFYLSTAASSMMNGASGFIFTTDRERTSAVRAWSPPSYVVPVGLDWNTYETLPLRGTFRRHHPVLGQDPYLLFLGRISRQKGMDLLIRAFQIVSRSHPSLRLVVAGPDSEGYQRQVVRWVADAGLTSRVHFVGRVPDQLKVAAYVDSDMFVLPSYAENFGAVITEAMACGRAVVMSDRVNVADEMLAADAAVVAACDADAVARAIDELLRDPARREWLGARARALVQTHYTWDVATTELINVYSRVLSRPGANPALESSSAAI